jgi:hypothetical protein
MTTAFVLGNGRSRMSFNLEKLRKKGTIYGCNALYRDFKPDHLIAVDPKMIFEICQTGWQLTTPVWTNPNQKYRDLPNLNFFKDPRGWSSGPTAVMKACQDHHQTVFILGFDYQGMGNFFNNVYADTFNYKGSNEQPTYFGNWKKQTETLYKEYPNVKFFRVNGENPMVMKDWQVINNFRDISYDEFGKMIETI